MFGFNKRKSDVSKEEIDSFIKRATIRLEGKVGSLEKAKIELEKKVKERTNEIEKKVEDLEKSRRALINILEDVEKAQAEAERERDKTMAIITNFTDGLIVLDKNEVVIMVNFLSEEMFKMKESELIGKNIKDIGVKHLLKPAVDLIFEKGKIKKVTREEFSPEDEVTIEVTTVPLKEKDEDVGYLAIFHDISREKLIERMKSEFVSISAHQLRTPLSAIKWGISLLQEGGIDEKERDELIIKVQKSNERMIRLVNDLLDVSRIEEGRYIYKTKKESLTDLINKLLFPIKSQIKRKNIKLELFFPENEAFNVEMDREKVSLCVQNFLENAVNYTPQKGKITVSLKEDKEKKEIIFSVKDTGIGIAPEQQKRVFSKFFRGVNAVKADTEGTGLGLFITKNIIESHKGRVWFTSRDEVGSEFNFSLPYNQ